MTHSIDDLATEVARLRSELEALKTELTTERINIVEPDGTLKLVMSSSARQHGGAIDGYHVHSRDRKRPAGLIYFNDEGTECGGIAWTGKEVDGRPQAGGWMTFDRFRNDEAVSWGIEDAGDQWAAGFTVSDRPAQSLKPFLSRYDEIQRMPEGPDKESAMEALRAEMGEYPPRLFLGRDAEGRALLELKDGVGRVRARLSVLLDGMSRLEFMDDSGAVVTSLP